MHFLLNIDYTDDTRKFYSDSYIKNRFINKKDNQTIHEAIAQAILENDGMELLYKGKPRGNIYIDLKDGSAKPVGYMYRAKTTIDNKRALFDVWATIKKIEDADIENIDPK